MGKRFGTGKNSSSENGNENHKTDPNNLDKFNKFNSVEDNVTPSKNSTNHTTKRRNNKIPKINTNGIKVMFIKIGQKIKQRPKTSILVGVSVIILLIVVKGVFFSANQTQQALQKGTQAPKNELEGDKQQNQDITGDAGTTHSTEESTNTKTKHKQAGYQDANDIDQGYLKDNTVFKTVYVPSSKDRKTGTLTYMQGGKGIHTTLNEPSNTKAPISAQKVSTQPLYGFGAFKDEETGKWIRIPGIQPIPKVDAQYRDYGGYSKDVVSSSISSRKAIANQTLSNAKSKNTQTTLNFGKGILTTLKDNPAQALAQVGKSMQKQASSFAKPLDYYYQDSFHLPLTASESQKLGKDQQINVLNEQSYGLVDMESINALNAQSQTIVPEMVNNWGLNVAHSIYVYNDKSYIVIDGVAYNYSEVMLDLYNNPQGKKSSNSTNLLGQEGTRPNNAQYTVQLYNR